MRSVFSGDRETELVGGYLPDTGTFVEVGAFDPFDYSQTWHLEKRGWRGLLIEPVPRHAERLRKHRSARVYECACGSPEQHGLTLPIYENGQLSSLAPINGTDNAVNVKVVTLGSILAHAEVTHIDFLSIDVETLEVEVLKGFPFDDFRPRLILLEDHGYNLTTHRFMRAKRYKRVRKTGNNSWYVPDETSFRISAFGWLQLCRKFYLSMPVRQLKAAIRNKTLR